MIKRSWFWPQTHNDVVQKILRKVRKGAQVICVPGNHDEFLSHFLHLQFGGITIAPEAVHVTADGRTLWVLHGDAFDSIVRYAPWLASLGNNGYDFMIVSAGGLITCAEPWVAANGLCPLTSRAASRTS